MTRRTMDFRLGLPLVIGAFAIAACAGGSPPTPAIAGPGGSSSPAATLAAAPAAQACELLTDADIEEITGTTVVSKDDNVADTVYANHCRWTLERPDGGNGTLDLGILSPGGRERYDHSGGSSGLEPIDGLPADLAGRDTNFGSIFAVRGDTLVDVYALGLVLQQDKRVALVRRVLEHLFGSGGPPATAATGGQTTPSTGGNGGGTASDPCSLLTDEEILDVTGYAALGHSGFPRGNAQWDATCIWEVDSGGTVPATITVNIKSPGGRASWNQYMIPFQAEYTAIEGLGDAAFAKVHWPTHVLAGDTYVSVQFVEFPDPEEPISTELARRVVENLGT